MANWWEEKPLRLVQTNLRQLDAQRDPREIIRQVKDLHANTILFSVGGIVSFYPTQLEFQTPIPDLKGDFVGEAVDEAHKQGIRFLARIDLSKCHKHVYVSHPEWFYLRANGQPVLYNGLYATCVNGAYYRDYALEIVQEILGRYPVDGFFFNMFSYRTTDYSGEYSGLCYCPACVRRFQEMYGRALPKAEELRDPAYRDFMEFQWIVTDEVTAKITDFVHQQRDNVAVAHGSPPVMRTPTIQHADIIRSESGFGWQYSASDNVKKIRGSYPATPISNSANYFRNIPHRFAAVSPHQIGLRLAQDMANGAGTDLYVLGTWTRRTAARCSPPKRSSSSWKSTRRSTTTSPRWPRSPCVMPVQSFTYGIRGEGLFHGVEDGYRAMFNLMQGTFRLLTESHIPFDTIYDFSLDGDDGARLLARYDLLVLPGAACLSDEQAKAIDRLRASRRTRARDRRDGASRTSGPRPRVHADLRVSGRPRGQLQAKLHALRLYPRPRRRAAGVVGRHRPRPAGRALPVLLPERRARPRSGRWSRRRCSARPSSASWTRVESDAPRR